MIYEGMRIVGITKPFTEYKKKYIICVQSSKFWVVYDETNNPCKAKDIVNTLEYDDNECIIIRNKKGGTK